MSHGKIKKSELTEIQEDVLEMVVVGQRLAMAGLGVVPSYREIGEWMGWRSPGGSGKAMEGLERKGFIRRQRNCSRAIEVLRVLDGGLIPGAGDSEGDISSPSGALPGPNLPG
jgi:SOS-response transcriptional repressor LexA